MTKKNFFYVTAKMKFFTNKSVSSKKIYKSTVGNWRRLNNDELQEVNSTMYAIIKNKYNIINNCGR